MDFLDCLSIVDVMLGHGCMGHILCMYTRVGLVGGFLQLAGADLDVMT